MRLEIVRLGAAVENSISEPAEERSRVLQNSAWPALIGVSVMALLLVLLPLVERTWQATGDEPHYLLAAHSLVTDGDFDLTNNYDQLDYLAFYPSKDIDRQIRTNPSGQQILDHQLGFPLLIAPAYALAGRLGVLVFQAMLGGLLAMLTYKLALFVSGAEKASLLATVFVVLSPPLLMYHFLIYPELAGALATTFIVYVALTRSRPGPGSVGLVVLAFIILPWLNRRFIPLAVMLALFQFWSWCQTDAGRDPSFRLDATKLGRFLTLFGRPSRSGLVAVLATVVSIGLLLWFNSRLDQPAHLDITAPATILILWNRLGRGIGWLVDQQRGLFIFGPIYIFALWGIPPLLHDSLQQRRRSWFVLMPFLLSLGVTIVAGGYWIPWELGPRFLVVALPALAPLFALAWREYAGHIMWAALALLLFGFSLLNSWVIIQNPELPYKSSLAAAFSQTLGFPLTEYLPDVAAYDKISVAMTDPAINQVIVEDDQPIWFAEAGRSDSIVRSEPLVRLPFGHYWLTWPVRIEPGLAPETEVMRITAKLSGGGQVFNKVITAADLPADGSYGQIEFAFLNPNIDRWRMPIVLHAVSTGQSSIWAKDIWLTPDGFRARFLPYAYITVFAVGAVLAWSRQRGSVTQPDLELSPSVAAPRWIVWAVLLIVPAIGFGYLAYQVQQGSRTYDAIDLDHFTGQPLADPAARGGQAWLVDPAVDPPQKAIYGPFEFYEPGRYMVTFRMKLPEPIATDQDIARLQVNATTNFEALITQPLRREHFTRPDLYHEFVLTIDNPRRQALSFEVYYLGLAALVIDDVTITGETNRE